MSRLGGVPLHMTMNKIFYDQAKIHLDNLNSRVSSRNRQRKSIQTSITEKSWKSIFFSLKKGCLKYNRSAAVGNFKREKEHWDIKRVCRERKGRKQDSQDRTGANPAGWKRENSGAVRARILIPIFFFSSCFFPRPITSRREKTGQTFLH